MLVCKKKKKQSVGVGLFFSLGKIRLIVPVSLYKHPVKAFFYCTNYNFRDKKGREES
jgi:hypothetical protein